MKDIPLPCSTGFWRPIACACALALLGACSALNTATAPPPVFYALDQAQPARSGAPERTGAPTLLVSPARAAAGFDSQRIIYVREDHKLEYFAHSEWVDPPARMLGVLLVGALERSGAFRAVVPTAGAAAGELRLDTEIVRLQHQFQGLPSRVRFTLRATLVDDKTRRVLAWREFDREQVAASDDPYGGVVAANQAVQGVLQELASFCAESVAAIPGTP